MPNEVLTFDQDIEKGWTLIGGATHNGALNSPNQASYIYAIVSPTLDRIGLNAPVGPIGTITQMNLTVKFNFVANSSGGWVGIVYTVSNGAVVLGGLSTQLDQYLGVFSMNYQIPLIDGNTDDLRIRFRAEGNSWGFAEALIAVYQVIPTLVYTSPAVEKSVVHICIPFEKNEMTLPVESEEMELSIADNEIGMDVAPEAIEMHVSDAEISLEVDADEEEPLGD